MRAVTRQKRLGAYYTHPSLVGLLVRWGCRGAAERVLDPSCGDGRFLREAACHGAGKVLGLDRDATAVREAERSVPEGTDAEWRVADFFRVSPAGTGPVDVVLGNPPYIRFQRFEPRSRERALDSARALGVELTRLTSTWAPFLLHALRFLRRGGRLGMVLPAELVQTQYGVRTLQAIVDRFQRVELVALEFPMFEGAQTETYLLLAESYRRVPERSACAW